MTPERQRIAIADHREVGGRMMKERPILFSGPMVRAILDGRKTQTRRVVKFPVIDRNGSGCEIAGCELNSMLRQERDQWAGSYLSPFGQPGDRLWVRETWRNSTDRDGYACINYRADDKALSALADSGGDGDWVKLGGEVEPMWKGRKEYDEQPWRPSTHMPRWASRITLEVTGVRVERLQDISEEDAIAEGCEREFKPDGSDYGAGLVEARENYAALWESINGKGSWDANPWVWVITFKKAEEECSS